MSQPFYVSPEQVMKDRADYARKGIARGRSLVALECADGVLLLAENPSRTLFKISELYDRIAFAGVGKYNEFQSLKIGGVRLADLKGYQYSREDVTANGIANAYAQTLGQVFTSNAERGAALAPWLDYYNNRRRHSALGGLPPISRLSPT
jgi:proteasome alpha subunit